MLPFVAETLLACSHLDVVYSGHTIIVNLSIPS